MLTVLFPYVLHSWYLTLLPGGKKIGWSWSEACVGCSWKSLEWTVECNKLKNPVWHSSLPEHTYCWPQTSPQDLPARMFSKCFCISPLSFPRSSVFISFQRFTPHFPNPSPLPRPQLSSIMPYRKVKFCRPVPDSSLDPPLAQMLNKQGYTVSHMCKELCKPILRWYPRLWAPWGRHYCCNLNLHNGLCKGSSPRAGAPRHRGNANEE